MQTNANGQPLTIDDLKFSITLNELNDLMKMKGHEAFEKLENDHGGLENLAKKLKTNLNNGIDENADEIARRIHLYGRNQIPLKSSKSIFILAFEAIQDTTLIMLILCSFVSIGLSFYNPSYPQNSNAEENRLASTTIASTSNLEWVEGAAILVAVLVVVFVTAFNDWRKEKQFRALKDRIETDNLTSVIREGVVKQVNVKDLVVGDVCCVKYGDLVPADGIVILLI
jgi:Ca2+ transporting ATPase